MDSIKKAEYVNYLLKFLKENYPHEYHNFMGKKRLDIDYGNENVEAMNEILLGTLIFKKHGYLDFEDFKKEVRKDFFRNGTPLPFQEKYLAEKEDARLKKIGCLFLVITFFIIAFIVHLILDSIMK